MPAASEVWKFFRKSDNKKSATCNICSLTLQLGGGTSNLCNHMKFKHPCESKSPQETMKQVTITAWTSSPRKASAKDSERVTECIADMVVSSYVPLSIVQSDGFKTMMSVLAPDYIAPCREKYMS